MVPVLHFNYVLISHDDVETIFTLLDTISPKSVLSVTSWLFFSELANIFPPSSWSEHGTFHDENNHQQVEFCLSYLSAGLTECEQGVRAVCPDDGGVAGPPGRLPAPHVLHLADPRDLHRLRLHHQGGGAQVHEGPEAVSTQAVCHRLQHLPDPLQLVGLPPGLEVR